MCIETTPKRNLTEETKNNFMFYLFVKEGAAKQTTAIYSVTKKTWSVISHLVQFYRSQVLHLVHPDKKPINYATDTNRCKQIYILLCCHSYTILDNYHNLKEKYLL